MAVVFTPLPPAIYRPGRVVAGERCDESITRRIRGEYLEMPGLCLTFDQARRLWALDDRTCASALQDLLVEGFLRVSSRGAYVRAR